MGVTAVQGHLAVLIATVLFGASVVATRVVVQEVPPITLAVLRFGQGAILLWLCLLIRMRNRPSVPRRDLLLFALLGAILFGVFPLAFNFGLRLTEASRGALMLATGPLWSLWFAQPVRNQRPVFRQVVGAILTVVGIGMVLVERGLHWPVMAWTIAGDALLLFGAFSGTLYVVLAQRAVVRYGGLLVTAHAMGFGTAFLLPVAVAEYLLHPAQGFRSEILPLVLFLGIAGGACAYLLWMLALARLTVTQVMVYGNLNPTIAAMLAASLLAEQLTKVFAGGFIAVIAGILLVNWPTNPAESLKALESREDVNGNNRRANS